jgi:Domain of unknown function (DUF4082)
MLQGPQNTGTHVAGVWNSTGTLLATATFTNETARGWQQVNFSTPVAVTASMTHIASSSGGNGVYARGRTSHFPTNSYNSFNYGVDFLFKPQLTA